MEMIQRVSQPSRWPRLLRGMLAMLLSCSAGLAPAAARAQPAQPGPDVRWTIAGWWNSQSDSYFHGSFVYDAGDDVVRDFELFTPEVEGASSEVAFPWHYGPTARVQHLPGVILITDHGDSGLDAPDGSTLYDDYGLLIDTHSPDEVTGTVFDPAHPAVTIMPVSQHVIYWIEGPNGPESAGYFGFARAAAVGSYVPAIPEPGSAAVLAAGMAALAGVALRRRRVAARSMPQAGMSGPGRRCADARRCGYDADSRARSASTRWR